MVRAKGGRSPASTPHAGSGVAHQFFRLHVPLRCTRVNWRHENLHRRNEREREQHMKTQWQTILAVLAFGTSVLAAGAQDFGPPPDGGPGGGGPRGGGPRHRPPPLPLVLALDTNHDGIIDSNEIANASAGLLTLDKNGDGVLTPDEYLPPLPTNAPANFHRPPLPAIVRALDTNGDGVIDANEIANAPAALKTLDKRGDGRLTPDEYIGPRPPRPDGADMGGPPFGPPPRRQMNNNGDSQSAPDGQFGPPPPRPEGNDNGGPPPGPPPNQ